MRVKLLSAIACGQGPDEDKRGGEDMDDVSCDRSRRAGRWEGWNWRRDGSLELHVVTPSILVFNIYLDIRLLLPR